jgi:peptidoglycan/LPS O-acetylase OafA/YrhL
MPAFEVRTPALPAAQHVVIDELKGFAILLIVLYHAGGVLVWGNYLHGDVGVDVFLILSGMGLALNAREEPARDFFRRRILRLMPIYWIVLTAYLIANTVFLQHRYSSTNIVAHYLGAHALFGDPIALAINDSFWFVSAILGLYAAYWFMRRQVTAPDRFIFWVGLLSAAVALTLFFTKQSGLMGHLGLRVPAFFVGVLLGHLVKQGRIEVQLSLWFGTGLFFLAYVPYTHGITFYSGFVALGLMAVYTWGVRPSLAQDSRVSRGLRFLGTHSLEIFLLHQPLIREYNYYLHGRWLNEPSPSALSLCAGMALGLAVTLMLSIELHRLQAVLSRR